MSLGWAYLCNGFVLIPTCIRYFFIPHSSLTILAGIMALVANLFWVLYELGYYWGVEKEKVRE